VDTLLVVTWSILGGLWLITAPGVLVAFGAVGDPPPGSRPGWVVAFLGWLSTPVTVIVALAGGGPWLPVVYLLVIAAGWLVGLVSVRLVARRRRGPPS
jgi:hypothetical protein